MSETLVIDGGIELSGEVEISSAKNAAVAILPAVAMASEIVKLYDVPEIDDVDALIHLLNKLNIKVVKDGSSLTIDPTSIENVDLIDTSCNKLRASYYFLGALLGRFKHCKMLFPGGCNLGPRPIDLHLKGFEALGARITNNNGIIEMSADQLIGDDIYLDIASVGATINIMMAAVFASGRTVINNAAKEPEIVDLSNMLNKMGARIRGAGTSEITIDGINRLKGCIHDIIPDRIEAGTYVIMAAACGKDITIKNVIPQHIESMLSKLEEMGVKMEIGIDYIKVFKTEHLRGCDVKTLPYPGFATDLQQPITVLMAKASGTSSVVETIYKERFKHCSELNKMGTNIEALRGMALIHGNTNFVGCDVTATDLRCGAALIIAALCAKGTTVIHDPYHIFRGYANIVEKLTKLGAKVRVNNFDSEKR